MPEIQTSIRSDFPILQREVKPGVPLVYLDSAATSQKPSSVLDAMSDYYLRHNANIHRGVHTLAEEATSLYEDARKKICRFINARSQTEIIYTRNTTESINLVANSWGRKFLKPGDVVILTEMEHHSNLVPWQILRESSGIELRFIPVSADGRLDLAEYANLLKLEPKLVSFTHASNVLGTINPVQEMAQLAHKAGALVLVDGAQSAPHFTVDVQQLGVDFYAFSAHKMLGPTGIGVLYGRKEILEKMQPFMGGGDMIREVRLEGFTPNDLPYKFEAGTPAIAEAVGFGAAVDYLARVGMDAIHAHEKEITRYAYSLLSEMPGITIFGRETDHRGGVIAFEVAGIHPHDVAQVLDTDGIAVRAGHHCAMPLHQKFGIPATARASFYLYTTKNEIDKLVTGLQKVQKLFG
jgi:cysteine desulfurase/selenocysteine lyase